MKMFGYGDRFITMIKLLHNGSSSLIENNDHFSNNIPLSGAVVRGTQSPRISLYRVRNFYLTVSGSARTLRSLRYMALKL